MKLPVIRSSSLPMMMACAPAVLNPHGLQVVESENEPALVGTLVHGLCEELVRTGAVELDGLKSRLSEEDYDRAAVLFNNFLTVWTEAKQYMTSPQLEEYLESILPQGQVKISGHIDCFHRDTNRAFVLDYKTGRVHEDHYHQMAAYAYLIWDSQPGSRPADFTVYVSTVYLEDNSVHPYTFTAHTLEQWGREVENKAADTRYTTGRKCAVCTLQDTCPAYRVYADNAKRVMLQHVPGSLDWQGMQPEERGQIVDQMYVLDKMLDRIRLSLRNVVKSKGAVDIGSGKEYALVETTDRVIDVEKAVPVLAKRIGLGNVHRNSRLPLESVLATYASKAAKGKKAVARKELLAELEAAGAIQQINSTRMWRKPKGEKTLEVK